MENCTFIIAAYGKPEHRPFANGVSAVTHLFAEYFEFCCFFRMLHQVPFRNFKFWNILHHLLKSALVDDSVEHVVFARNCIPNIANFLRFKFCVTDFQINMASDAAVFKSLATSEQISGLHVGQWEWFKSIYSVNDD